MASFMPDPEIEDRRSLLKAAAQGSISAKIQLQEEYHVRVYSASECASYAVTLRSDNISSAVRRKIERVTEIDDHTDDEEF